LKRKQISPQITQIFTDKTREIDGEKNGRICFIPLAEISRSLNKTSTEYTDKHQNNLCLSV